MVIFLFPSTYMHRHNTPSFAQLSVLLSTNDLTNASQKWTNDFDITQSVDENQKQSIINLVRDNFGLWTYVITFKLLVCSIFGPTRKRASSIFETFARNAAHQSNSQCLCVSFHRRNSTLCFLNRQKHWLYFTSNH